MVDRPANQGGGQPPGGEGGAREPFSVANLLKAQQRLLSGAQAPGPGQGHTFGASSPGPIPDGRVPDGAQFGIQEYLDVILRRKGYLAIPLLLVPLMAALYSSVQPDEFEAESKLLLTRSLVGQGVVDDMSGTVYVTSAAISQMAELESVRRKASGSVIAWVNGEDEGLLGKLWRGEGQTGVVPSKPRWTRDEMTSEEAALLKSDEEVFDLVSFGVNTVPDTQNVSVSLIVRHGSRLVAAAIGDAVAAAMADEFVRMRAEQSSTALIRHHMAANQRELEEVNRLIAELRRKAAESNKKIEGFPLEVERQYELLKSQLFELRSLDYMIEESKRLRDLLQKRVDDQAEKGPAPPEAFVQRLIDLEIERDQMSGKYTESHPKMIKLTDDIAQTRKAIQQYSDRRRELGIADDRPNSYIDPVVQLASEEAKLAGLHARRGILNGTATEIRKEIQNGVAQERSLQYELLLADRQVLQDTSVALRTRLQRAELTEGDTRNNPARRIIKPVPAETRRVGPHRWMTITLGVMMGSFAGLLLAFLAERLDETVRLPAEMRALAGYPTLQVIPYLKRNLAIRPEETTSEIANVFAVLRNNIRYGAPGSPERSILVTSATPGEGKSLVALNLAISFAQEGNRTCMIDADIQKGQHHALEEAVKLSWEPQVGLTGFLEGQANYEHIVVPSLEMPNLSFVSSGGRAMNPPRALRGEVAATFFRQIMEEFDIVVVDAPPVLPVVDAAILSGYCRSTVLLARYGYTRRQELEESARRMKHVGAPVVGLVLNGARIGTSGSYYSRNYYGPGSAA
jgi:receptor protein-tyrosine kinase